MKKIKVTQVKSLIKRPQRQKDTVRSLGLRRIGHSVEFENPSPSVLGMVEKVVHLVSVEEVQ